MALRRAPRDSSRNAARVNRASFQVEAGISGFLSISNFDHRVSAELEQESQASSCVEKWNSITSRVVNGVTGHLLSCIWILWLFPDNATGVSVALPVVTSSSGLHSKSARELGIILSGWGNR